MSDWKMLESGLKRDEERERFDLRDVSRMTLLYILATWLGSHLVGCSMGSTSPVASCRGYRAVGPASISSKHSGTGSLSGWG